MDSEDVRSLKEFDDAVEEIHREMGLGASGEALTKAAELGSQEVELAHMAHIGRLIALREGTGTGLIHVQTELANATRAANVGGFVTTGIGVAAEIYELKNWVVMAHSAVDNLDRSTRSQARMLAMADEKWKKLLDDAAKAIAQDEKCLADLAEREKVKQQLKADAALEAHARHYIESLETAIINPNGQWQSEWVIGNRAYTDYQSALNAALQLLAARRQSGAIRVGAAFYLASYSTGSFPADSLRLSRADVQNVLALLKRAQGDLNTSGRAYVSLVRQYIDMVERVHALAVQIGRAG